jgi:hypothetical protein
MSFLSLEVIIDLADGDLPRFLPFSWQVKSANCSSEERILILKEEILGSI